MCLDQAVFQSNSAAATATVVGYHSYHAAGKGSCPAHISYNVKGSFTTTDGSPVTDVVGNLCYYAPLANGVTLPIRYDINDPSRAQSGYAADNWGFLILILGIGALFVVGLSSSSEWENGGAVPGTQRTAVRKSSQTVLSKASESARCSRDAGADAPSGSTPARLIGHGRAREGNPHIPPFLNAMPRRTRSDQRSSIDGPLGRRTPRGF